MNDKSLVLVFNADGLQNSDIIRKEPVMHSLSTFALAVDGTPAYLWDYDGWEKIAGNEGLKEPRYILPHAIYELVPNAKIIAILRDPADR